VPGLSVPAVSGGAWSLSDRYPHQFMRIVVCRTLYFATAQTMPFARPHFNELLQAMDLVLKSDYPARGEA